MKLYRIITAFLVTVVMLLSSTAVHAVNVPLYLPTVATGENHALAVRDDGVVVAWGAHSSGQLGTGTPPSGSPFVQGSTVPVVVSGLPANIISVAAGRTHSLALASDGHVYRWGSNGYYELGDPNIPISVLTQPTPDFPTLYDYGNAVAIAAGEGESYIITNAGQIQVCGYLGRGKLGQSYQQLNQWSANALLYPVPNVTNARKVVPAPGTTMALTATGAVYTWGTSNNTPTQKSSLTATDIAMTQSGCFVLQTDGTVKWWVGTGTPVALSGVSGAQAIFGEAYGNRLYYRTANGSIYSVIGTSGTPQLMSGVGDVTELSASGRIAVARSGHYAVATWGEGEYGQLGDGSSTTKPHAVLVSGPTGIVKVVEGERVGAALTSANEVWVWGDPAVTSGSNLPMPRKPAKVTSLSGITDIAVGDDYFLALRGSDGAVYAWGLNNSGQLGMGNTTPISTPTLIPGLTGVTALSAYRSSSFALLSNKTAKSWGENFHGQLGSGNTTNRLTPDLVKASSGVNLPNITAISAGYYHTLFLITNGSVRAVGQGTYALGRSNTADAPFANTVVSGLTSGVVQISAGDTHNLARTSTGAVKAWGENSTSGALGTGNTTEPFATVTVAMPGGLAATYVSAVGHTSFSVTSAGTYAWGSNGAGEYGNGTFTTNYTPTNLGVFLEGYFGISGKLHTLGSSVAGIGFDQKLNVWGNCSPYGSGNIRAEITYAAVGMSANPLDTDRDGMQDGFEVQKFGNLSKIGSEDDDSDGFSTMQEFLAVTDPLTADVPTFLRPIAYGRTGPNAAPALEDSTSASIPVRAEEPSQLSLSYVVASNPSHGAIAVGPTGTFLYTPVHDFTGIDSFTYYVFNGTTASLPATVEINVINVDDPPTAHDIVVTTDEDTALTLPLNANVTDIDGPAFTYTFGTPRHGTVAPLAGGLYKYVPAANYNGQDIFQYTVSDGTYSSSATVFVTVNPVYDPISITLTSPTNNQSFTIPIVSPGIAVNAVVGNLFAGHVDFFANGTQFASVPATGQTNFSANWLTNIPGNYDLVAKAFDNEGHSVASNVAHVTIQDTATIAIVAPHNGDSFTTPAGINIGVQANIPGATVTKAEFFANGNPIGATTSVDQNSFTWITSTPGTYALTVRITDSLSNVRTSAPVTVTVVANQFPTVAITSPTNGQTGLMNGQSITISATASDVDDGLAYVEFFADGQLVSKTATTPYSATSPVLYGGLHTFLARATDKKGNSTNSAPVSVNITGNKAPVVTITSPAPNATIPAGPGDAPVNVTVTASVTDPDGDAIAAVTFWVDNVMTVVGEPPYQATYSLSVGLHTIVAAAQDANGAIGTSDTIYVEVAGSRPSTTAMMNELVGVGITASNPVFTGDRRSELLFTGGLAAGLQIDNGLLMTTGLSDYWNGVNEVHAISTGLEHSGDRDLDRLTGNLVSADATVLEFDVVPVNGQLEIRYEFASDEYPEYVGAFNDNFAIFVDGVNIAVVPGSADQTAVDTVNDHRNVAMYIDNNDDDFSTPPPAPHLNEFDGYTIAFTAVAAVTANQTHHIKIAIQDVSDEFVDSGIFLSHGSLKSVTP